MKYGPLNLGRWIVWGGTALVMIVLPLIFTSGFTLTLMSQIGIGIIFALSYNMLLGQGGMLSFGHAVYSGLGAYFAVHALNLIGKGSFWFPVTLLPLIGGVRGPGVRRHLRLRHHAQVRHHVRDDFAGHRRDGVRLLADVPGFLRRRGRHHHQPRVRPAFPRHHLRAGDPGVLPDRGLGARLHGGDVRLDPDARSGAWPTPCATIPSAPNSSATTRIWCASSPWCFPAFFAGIAGGLSCINYEIVTAENVGAVRSGGVLLATFIGGAGFFFGPIIGSIVFFIMVTAVGAVTQAWLFYLGLLFLVMVLYAPGGFASLIAMHVPVIKARLMRRLWLPYAAALATGLVLLTGLMSVVEITYHYSLEASTAPEMTLFGFAFNVTDAMPWAVAAGLLVGGFVISRFAWKAVGRAWADIIHVMQQKSA